MSPASGALPAQCCHAPLTRPRAPDSSSRDRGSKFSFKLGVGQVIKCWDEGVAQMKIGERAVLDCTSDVGYGSRGAGGVIPPDADLLFDVELFGFS